MPQTIHFTLNGKKRSLTIQGWEKIIDVLRENLALTGTKRGCDDGTCGACTILINGTARKSCLLPAAKLDGTTVLTIEGIQNGPALHPIQQALIDAGAVQCGYCIPGIVLELYALFSHSPSPTDDQLKTALSRHLCRCTGYEALLAGAILARERLRPHPPTP